MAVTRQLYFTYEPITPVRYEKQRSSFNITSANFALKWKNKY